MAWLVTVLSAPSAQDVQAYLETGEAAFVGAERCRLCHRSVYLSWEKTAHRRAADSLGEQQSSAICLRCHGTRPALPGVQCEACHGAGGNYWPAEVMMDPDKVRRAGLVEPSETVCRTCHGSSQPGHSATFVMPIGPELSLATH
jgi:hypothetical protein